MRRITRCCLKYKGKSRQICNGIVSSPWMRLEPMQQSAVRCQRHDFSSQSATSDSWKDPALVWAAANPIVAQACLDIPSSNNYDAKYIQSSENNEFPFASFEDYWSWRQWNFPESSNSPFPQSLATHVLSAPLTIASKLRPMTAETDGTEGITRWICLGARAEASLPVEYWKEIIHIATQCYSMGPSNVLLDFVGPEIGSTKRQPMTLQLSSSNSVNSTKNGLPDERMDNCSKLTLEWRYNGKFHDYYNGHQSPPADAFILLNPGFGHPYLRKDWKPTLDILLEQPMDGNRKNLILLTAHSSTDARRDALYLEQHYEHIKPVYTKNPFSSRIQYQDPPNAYIAMLHI